METQAQIKSNLKRLRLSSMYENLEQRLGEAIQTKMGYADFLLILSKESPGYLPERLKYWKTSIPVMLMIQ